MFEIAVTPPGATETYRLLFAALELAYPVRFMPFRPDGPRPFALLQLDGAAAVAARGDASGCDYLFCAPAAGALATAGGVPPPADGTGGEVKLAASPLLERPLRDRVLEDGLACRLAPLVPAPGERILAVGPGGPVWLAHSDEGGCVERVAAPLPELALGDTLRDHLRGGRWLALLPLIQFLRRICGSRLPALPPLRATILFDDPNLHWPTYGYLHYGDLARHAAAHDYHVSIATIPLDGWLTHRGTVALFQAHRERLSLVIHGNDHVRHELARPCAVSQCEALLAQALRRTAVFERRTGLTVWPVMVPPHERVTEPMIRALLRLGYEAMTLTRVFSWRAQPPAGHPLADCTPAEPVLGGFPLLVRVNLRHALTLARHRDDLALRAFLGQPLILYGHHEDLAGGLDILAEAARLVGSLGAVRWLALGRIARTNYGVGLEGSRMRVQLHTRRAQIDIPPQIERLAIERAPGWDGFEPLRLRGMAAAESRSLLVETGTAVEVAGAGRVEVTLEHPLAADPQRIAAPQRRLGPYLRRILMEGRDRLRPIVRPAARARY